MLHGLPAETVLEAKHQSQRATIRLLLLLLSIYVFFFNILASVLFFSLIFLVPTVSFLLLRQVWGAVYLDLGTAFWPFHLGATAVGILIALIHFHRARSARLHEVLERLGAEPADPQDPYHSRFINIVKEAEAATGIRPIKAVVLPSSGANAFSVADRDNAVAIGATEGLLALLDRSELVAVVAHEAAHLVQGDSKLHTTACSLSRVFDRICSTNVDRIIMLPAVPVLWLISAVGYLLSSVTLMSVSRSRELLADANAVQMCKDPLSLAEALYKISTRYRGGKEVAKALTPLFILNPGASQLDERDGVVADSFSTHPPLAERLQRLLKWARADLGVLKKSMEEPEPQAKPVKIPNKTPRFLLRHDSTWQGPYTPIQMFSLGLITPQSWVCRVGSKDISRARNSPFLIPLFEAEVGKAVSQHRCPRCNVSMISRKYEGASILHCSFCQGNLLQAGVLEKIIARREVTFSSANIARANKWRQAQKKGTVNDLCDFPAIKCPLCGTPMRKSFQSLLTRVIIDRCANGTCRAVWCDGGELEKIQILIEEATGADTTSKSA
jgi:heat shock protein HtpX